MCCCHFFCAFVSVLLFLDHVVFLDVCILSRLLFLLHNDSHTLLGPLPSPQPSLPPRLTRPLSYPLLLSPLFLSLLLISSPSFFFPSPFSSPHLLSPLLIFFPHLPSFPLLSLPSPQIDSEVVYPLVLDLDRRFLSQELQERLAAQKRDQNKAENALKNTVDTRSYDIHGEIW